ncbi:PREDICTED: DNA damage-binding protein 1 isoform X2 [Lupinus angustifolius]|uniref:DNA damage-binding protein 1 isoform X2 n=1 Tax=Lupinus angustifolius TaxID=3871 RepID=UPI00092ED879|nr:PREDICTED: DNA damage-binding protein 1 isoform X2 [Lupinus angustifolius]
MAVTEEECSSTKRGGAGGGASARSFSSSSSARRYYLSKCVLRGSVVLQLLYGHIRSPTSNDVVFAKETSIELAVIGEDGNVHSVCDQPVFGTIKDLAILPWNDKFRTRDPQMWGKDLLVALSDSGKLSLLTFCNEMHRFFPITHVELSNPGNPRDLPGRMLAIDSSGCFIAASAYEDRLVLFSMSTTGNDIIDERITYPSEGEGPAAAGTSRSIQRTSIRGTIWSMCFISQNSKQPSKEENPLLAVILNRKGSLLNELLLLEWNIKAHTIFVISMYVEAGPLAHDIVEVPNSCGLAFLFRAGDALLMDFRDPHNPCCVYRTSLNFLPNVVEEQAYVEDSCKLHDIDDERFNVAACALLELSDYDPMCIDSDNGSTSSSYKYVCSWCWEPENGKDPRMIFCIDSGEFFMIEIHFDPDDLNVNLSECLYKGLPCKALLWVEGGYLAALVEMGDGMLLKLEDGRLCHSNPIQNIAPILDMTVVDYHDERHDQMFACCGVAPEGSLRIIRSGISVEKLLRTAPIYQGVTGTWTVRMKVADSYHSFLVLSFVEETRILSVGLSFTDVTDSVGFHPNVCTLACGLVSDGLLVQIHQSTVRLCLPTKAAHPEGIPLSSPICTSWSPHNVNISLGVVGHNFVVVSTSNPSFLFILGVRLLSASHYEIYEMQHLELQNELSCISIPRQKNEQKQTHSPISANNSCMSSFLSGVDNNKTFIIGTHKPSVEIWSFASDGVTVVARGTISLTNTMGTAITGCVPQDVRLVFVDKYYVLAGLRNGMLLRFEWPAEPCPSSPLNVADTAPSSINLVNSVTNVFDKRSGLPSTLQLIAIRRIGITPVFLVPLGDTLDADIIALSDRPWLLHTARHSLSYTSISFQPSTHVTPVSSVECPKGILFVAENSLHLVEMVQSKRLNVQKFHLEGTPRKVLYHNESRMLLVMRTELNCGTCLSDICCVDPLSGSVLSSFRLELGETGKSMELIRVGSEQVLVVGTSLSSGPAIMPNGEAESAKGRLLVLCLDHVQNSDSGSMTFCSKVGSSSQRTSPFHEIVAYAPEQLSSSSLGSSPDDNSSDGIKLDENEVWQFRLVYATTWQGMVLAICPYTDHYFLASAGNAFYVCGFPSDHPLRVRRFAVGRTRFMVTSLTADSTRIAVGDCRDGILFYHYHEEARKFEQLYCDPSQRLVADCILMDTETAVVSDRKGSIAVLCTEYLEDNASHESNLILSCGYFMAEVAMSIQKGSYSYRLPADDVLQGGNTPKTNVDSMINTENTIIASTLLGSIIIFTPLSREEYELLEAVQARLVAHHLTAPVLGNDHNEFRSRENPVGVPKILDGDMLTQFLELTNIQQQMILSSSEPPPKTVKPSSKPFLPPHISVSQVVQLLERVHYALN